MHEDSDIDLVVEGLPNEKYIKALVYLDHEVLRGIDIHLIPYEEAFDSVKHELEDEGKLLYGKK